MTDKQVEDQKPAEQKNPKKFEKAKKEIKSITLIILVVFAFRSVFFEPFKIPSGSMIPTLLIGDFILVNKFSYGFKVPFSDIFGDPKYITGPEQPARGDVIVFKYPKDPNLNFIKRVIGLPGDTVEIVDKKVFVNDKEIETKEVSGEKIMEDMDEKYKHFNFKFYETQTGDHVHLTQIDEDNQYNNYMPRTVVPKNMYFVMGDNRDFSMDSRFWGFVPFENIKGKAFLVWFSMTIPWPWEGDDALFTFRPWRIGNPIN